MRRAWYGAWVLVATVGCTAQELRPEWGPHGELAGLRHGERLLLVDGTLGIPTPGWKATAGQGAATEVTQPDATTWHGLLTAGEVAATYRQQVRAEGPRLRYEITVEARRACDVQAVMWRASVPIEEVVGARWVAVTPDRVVSNPFPERLASQYILGGAEGPTWFGWVGPRGGVKVALEEDLGVRVQVQDNRQFNMPRFEFQLYATAPSRLEPGRPVKLAFTIEPVTADVLKQEEARVKPSHPSLKMAQPLAIRGVTPDRTTVPRYGRVELTVDLGATYDNPFDPAQIDVLGRFTAPSGKVLTVPGFLYRPFERSKRGSNETVKVAGPADWRVRFAPPEVGEWRCQVTATDRSGTVTGPETRFNCTAAPAAKGFVRVSPDDPHYFQFDDGSPYFAIGANVCWPRAGGTFDYDEWFPAYQAAGANYARLWLGPWDIFTFERKPEEGREDTGLGRFDLDHAWRLDYVVDLAERTGIYLMLCFESFNSLRINPPYAAWDICPYNAANGGPLAKPEEFFTNPEAQRSFRNRMRYLLARYGWSTHVMAWEYWNEVDIIQTYQPQPVRDWHEAMSRYLRELDPWKHLQTTSYARSAGDPLVDGLPEMDFVQTHNYGARDTAATLASWAATKRQFGKPHYAGEFGLDAGGSGADRDPDGDSFHDGLWSTLASGDAGAGMLWWWDSYIHPRNLYYHLAAVAKFTAGIDWPRAKLQPTSAATAVFAVPPAQPELEDLVLTGGPSTWQPSPANRPNTFVIPRTGQAQGLERLSGIQHGVKNHPELHNPATFELDLAAPSRFNVVVRGVSGYGGAALRVTVDGREAVVKEFPDTNPPEKHDTLRQYAGKYGVDLPAGRHTVVVENPGADWFEVEYEIPDYVEVRTPRLRVLALTGDRLALAWVQHRDHIWSKLAEGVKPAAIAGAVVEVPGLAAGAWTVELWDTIRGEVVQTTTVTAAQGWLRVPLPAIESDLAVKARRAP